MAADRPVVWYAGWLSRSSSTTLRSAASSHANDTPAIPAPTTATSAPISMPHCAGGGDVRAARRAHPAGPSPGRTPLRDRRDRLLDQLEAVEAVELAAAVRPGVQVERVHAGGGAAQP